MDWMLFKLLFGQKGTCGAIYGEMLLCYFRCEWMVAGLLWPSPPDLGEGRGMIGPRRAQTGWERQEEGCWGVKQEEWGMCVCASVCLCMCVCVCVHVCVSAGALPLRVMCVCILQVGSLPFQLSPFRKWTEMQFISCRDCPLFSMSIVFQLRNWIFIVWPQAR